MNANSRIMIPIPLGTIIRTRLNDRGLSAPLTEHNQTLLDRDGLLSHEEYRVIIETAQVVRREIDDLTFRTAKRIVSELNDVQRIYMVREFLALPTEWRLRELFHLGIVALQAFDTILGGSPAHLNIGYLIERNLTARRVADGRDPGVLQLQTGFSQPMNSGILNTWDRWSDTYTDRLWEMTKMAEALRAVIKVRANMFKTRRSRAEIDSMVEYQDILALMVTEGLWRHPKCVLDRAAEIDRAGSVFQLLEPELREFYEHCLQQSQHDQHGSPARGDPWAATARSIEQWFVLHRINLQNAYHTAYELGGGTARTLLGIKAMIAKARGGREPMPASRRTSIVSDFSHIWTTSTTSDRQSTRSSHLRVPGTPGRSARSSARSLGQSSLSSRGPRSSALSFGPPSSGRNPRSSALSQASEGARSVRPRSIIPPLARRSSAGSIISGRPPKLVQLRRTRSDAGGGEASSSLGPLHSRGDFLHLPVPQAAQQPSQSNIQPPALTPPRRQHSNLAPERQRVPKSPPERRRTRSWFKRLWDQICCC